MMLAALAAVQLGYSPPPVAVFTSHTEGYSCFRIPSLLRLPNGDIALYAEGRKLSCADHGWNDLVYKISKDNGATWGPMQLLYSESNATKHVAIGNPAPVALADRVLLLFCRNNREVLMLRSADAAGRVWPAAPMEVTKQLLGKPLVSWVATGPPGGVRVGGRVIVAANWGGSAGVFITDDGGDNWVVGGRTFIGGNEGQVAITPSGLLLLNMRMAPAPEKKDRQLAWSSDLGTTWSAPMEWVGVGSACEGSTALVGGDTLLFSHNHGPEGRENLTVWASGDSGARWHIVEHVDKNVGEPAAYSTLLEHNATHAALAYERGMGYRNIVWRLVAFR